MSEKKFGKRLLAWALTMVLTVSLLPLSALAGEKDSNNYDYNFTLVFAESSPGVYLTYTFGTQSGTLEQENGKNSVTFRTDNGNMVAKFEMHVPAGYVAGGSFDHSAGVEPIYQIYETLGANGEIGEFHYTISAALQGSKNGTIYVSIAANPIDYTVRYDPNGGQSAPVDNNKYRHPNAIETSDSHLSEIAIASDEPVRPGYRFLGWKLRGGDGSLLDTDSAPIEVSDYWFEKAVVGDVKNAKGEFVLVAQWEEITHDVTFVYNNAANTQEKKEVQDGSAVSKPADPTWEGHHFLGWYTDEDCTKAYDFGAPVKDDFTLYGKWALNQYTVTFDSDGGSAVEPQSVEYNEKASEPANPTKDNYTFDGWYLNGNEYDFGAPVTNDITLVAHWNPVSYDYTVNYLDADSNEAIKRAKTKSVAFGSEIKSEDEIVTIDGYEFKEANVPYLTITEIATDNVINLYYTKRSNLSYTVNYYWNGTSEKVAASKMVTGQTFDTSITESPIGVNGYTAVSAADKSITIGTGTNEINFYYYKNVELTANSSESVIYDGKEHSVSGFTGAPAGADFSAITVGAKGTDAGTYEAKFPERTVGMVDATEKYIVIAANNGELVINPRAITLTSEGGSKTYDGTALTKPEVAVTGDGFVDGEVSEIKAIGSVTNVSEGEVANSISYTASDSFKAGNYSITKSEGKLHIDPIKQRIIVKLQGNSDTLVYTGEEQSVSGYTVTDLGHDLYKAEYFTFATVVAKGTAVGSYEMPKAQGTDFENHNKNFESVDFEFIPGKLTITAAPVPTHTLTVKYVYANGSEAAETHIETIAEGATYNVSSPEISGYTADKAIVSGTMLTENVEVTVTYNENRQPSRPSHPSRPSSSTDNTVTIEDDDALGLNTTDHFAYIVGYGNGEVRPQNNITRAEVATIFFRLLTDDVRDENLTKTNPYSDVAATAWYNTAVSTLSSMGIITGYPDGTFRPNAAITRAEFAAIAARFDPNGDKTTASFSDIASHWAKDKISIAYNNGWINGYPDGTFGPQRDITRAETMTLVNRVLNRLPETEDDLLPNMTVWTDNANPKAWYYLAVQEATNSHYYEFKTNSQYEKWTELRETRDWTLLEK